MQIVVDYDSHPAFRPFTGGRAAASSGDKLFAQMDAALAEHAAGGDPDKRGMLAAAQSFSRSVEDDAGIVPAFKPYLAQAFERATARALEEVVWRNRQAATRSVRSAQVRERVDDLHEQGFTFFRMPRKTLDRMRALIAPDMEALRRKMAQTPDDIIIATPSDPKALDLLRDFCESSGLFAALSDYYGEEYHRVGFAIHLSHPKDTWFRVFDDLKLPLPGTAQMHFDLGYEVPKSMLYLNDVEDVNGPFSLHPKTEPWQLFGSSRLAFSKELLIGFGSYLDAEHGRKLTGNMSAFRFAGAREALGSLPHALRSTSHPGDHILDGTPLSRDLVGSERKLVGEAGSMPLFTGSHVLHRGGLVHQGERWALQIVFQPGGTAPVKRRMPRLGWGLRSKLKAAIGLGR